MTETQITPYVIEGPVEESRFGSVGFRLADPLAPSACRKAALELLDTFGLTWVPDLSDSVAGIVTELVANACAYGGDAFPAGSLTLWHPNRRLIISVHDKNPACPYWAMARRWSDLEPLAVRGRGLLMVKRLASEHCGTLTAVPDNDRATPGKAMVVNMLLPDVRWPHSFRDPYTGRVISGN